MLMPLATSVYKEMKALCAVTTIDLKTVLKQHVHVHVYIHIYTNTRINNKSLHEIVYIQIEKS